MNSKRAVRSASAFCLLALMGLAALAPSGSTAAVGKDTAEATTKTPAKGDRRDEKTATATLSRVRLPKRRVDHGSRIRVKGIVERSSRRVGLYFRAADEKSWTKLKKVETDARGRYSTSVTARRNGRVRAVSSNGTLSEPRKIRVRSRLSVKPVKKFTPVGSKVRIRGSVNPAGKRRIKVVIGGSGGRVIQTRSRADGSFAVTWRPQSTGGHRVRVFAAGDGSAASDGSRRIRVTGMRQTHASYFGPGLYGGALACGGRLYPGTRGVAHKTLPCGTRVTFRYRGRTVTTRVVDRGPFVAGREYDLTAATRNDLGFGDIGSVWTSR